MIHQPIFYDYVTQFFSRRQFLKTGAAGAAGLITLAHAQAGSFTEQAPLIYLDAYTRIGPEKVIHPANRWRLEDLLKEMDRCSISGALVAYTLSTNYDLHHSNLELSSMLKPYPHLHAIWNVMPHHSGEYPAPAELAGLVKQHNVRAFSIYPQSNSWDWKSPDSEALFRWISEQKMLVITQARELGTWSDVDEFLGRYPEVPLLLTSATYGEQRFVLPLMARRKNLHISFETFQINEGLEYLAGKGLADQLLFASNAPAMAVGAHRTFVDLARTDAATRQKIAGGNLARLLKLDGLPKARENKNEDALMAAVRRGTAPAVPIVDMHMHILDTGVFGVGRHYRMQNGDPKGVFKAVSHLGYQGGGLMSWNGIQSFVSEAGNETTRNALDLSPGGFWGLATFDPTHYSQQEMEQQIRKVYADPRFIGMKPYLFFGVEYHNAVYDKWWEFGNQHQFYALIHPSRADLLEVDSLAARYPRVRWVVAHTGSNYRMADLAIEMMKKHPNVYAEITFTSVTGGIIEYLVAGAGESRVVYGSDLPMRDPRQQLGWVIFSDLPQAAKERILARNAADIIRPCFERLPQHNRPAFLKNGYR
ncbi:hypothetical protein GCM10023091_22020 [Ravibacter arvi]|uniref:Amidohydrolase-related domain-containing protein n=1 Tax=Ravibacter arvi TaxID=2051041 RepID=A0ABP8LYB9_9BACT